jgi:6-phosphogluconolactonase
MAEHCIKILPNVTALAHEAAGCLVEAAAEAVRAHGGFSIALSGGSTPKTLYHLLSDEPYRSAIPWSKVHVYFGDERCVPPDHPDSNYHMAEQAMLSVLPIPRQQIHRIQAEREPAVAAAEYDALLHAQFARGGMDLVLLGMGDDGHTASLFPGSEALVAPAEQWCVANHSDKLHAWRITMTAPFINRAGRVMVLVSGSSKARRLHEVLEGPAEPMRLPIQLICPASGELMWLLDGEAAGLL